MSGLPFPDHAPVPARACRDCGKGLCDRNVSGLCRGCVGRATSPLRRTHPDKQCSVCGIPICRFGKNGLCREHFMSERMHTPEMQRKRTAGLRKRAADPSTRAAMRANLIRNHRRALERPSYRNYLRARMKELQPIAVAASKQPEALARRSQKATEARERRLEAEAKAARVKRPMTFEEQLQAVAEGRATISRKIEQPVGYHYTLGGVSDL
jgi:hypothetical protein